MSMGQWLPSFNPLSTAHLTTNYLGPPQDEASPTDLQPLLSCAARVNGLPLVARFTVPVLVKRVFNYSRPVPLYLLRLKLPLQHSFLCLFLHHSRRTTLPVIIPYCSEHCILSLRVCSTGTRPRGQRVPKAKASKGGR